MKIWKEEKKQPIQYINITNVGNLLRANLPNLKQLHNGFHSRGLDVLYTIHTIGGTGAVLYSTKI